METLQATHFNKPKTVRTIFISNLFKVFLALGFYYAFQSGQLHIDGVDPTKILYTAFAYAVLFGGMVISILKRNVITLRVCILLDFIISIPTTAVIGFVIAILSMGMSFTKSAKAFFAS